MNFSLSNALGSITSAISHAFQLGFIPWLESTRPSLERTLGKFATWLIEAIYFFHVANTAADLLGCIGLGLTVYPDLKGVGSSKNAIDKFTELTRGVEKEGLAIKREVLE